MAAIKSPQQSRAGAMTVMLIEMHKRRRAFWGWSKDEWLEILCPSTCAFRKRYLHTNGHSRQMLVAGMYLLRPFDDFRKLGIIDRTALACRIFGRSRVENAIARVVDIAVSWGYGRFQAKDVQWAVCTVLLANKSPRLEDLTLEVLEEERKLTAIHYRRASIVVLSRVLAKLGIVPHPLAKLSGHSKMGRVTNGVDPIWVAWVERWHKTSTLQENSRYRHLVNLLKVGRWVTVTYPEFTSPENWTRDLAAEWVAAVCRMKIGEWTQVDGRFQKNRGKPLSAKARAHLLSSLGTFFRDTQEWGWIPRRFDPRRSLAAPPSLRALIGPKPRVIDDDVWAKLLWAGLNLQHSDLTKHYSGNHYYPLAMVKALSVVWLFCGLRMDEIRRLPVGCTREHWKSSDDTADTVCNLDVPVNKTGQAFTKPVDQIVGESVHAWESERPQQPAEVDKKTGELVHFLFAYRSKRISATYINNTLVPILCNKAGVPNRDARGPITSHRARSTIASQLFNAKEPMSLFELQRWLGHKWANSTQHYLDISPTKLARSFRNAGYFARNIRAIEVLIDHEVVVSGKAAREPWRFYDLGHGYPAQSLAIMGIGKRWQIARDAHVVAECGAGKTLIALGAMLVHSAGLPFSALVMAPPHLVEKWIREAFLTLPGIRLFVIDDLRNGGDRKQPHGVNEVRIRKGEMVREGMHTSLSELRRLSRDGWRKLCPQSSIFCMGRDKAKLSYFWTHCHVRSRSGKYLGALTNPDTGCPIETDGVRLTATDFDKKRLHEIVEDRKGGKVKYSALWQADRNRIARMAPAEYMGRYMFEWFDYCLAASGLR
ncbi:MAG: tyrosine-type recombinase/integrase [Candidatus Korobacteraceae bacterium]